MPELSPFLTYSYRVRRNFLNLIIFSGVTGIVFYLPVGENPFRALKISSFSTGMPRYLSAKIYSRVILTWRSSRTWRELESSISGVFYLDRSLARLMPATI